MPDPQADPRFLIAMRLAEGIPQATEALQPPSDAPAASPDIAGQVTTDDGGHLLRTASEMGLVTVSPDSPKPARAIVMIDTSDAQNLAQLAAAHDGFEINPGKGRIRTAIVPLSALPDLATDPSVTRVQLARRLKPNLDRAADAVHLPAAVAARPTLTGKGVLVGIVDSGIDPHHPAFAGRILRIWDQTMPGPGVREGGYGAELTGSMMEISRDEAGHGTHVAGIAAGDDDAFPGVAREAELLIVKSDLIDAHIADGLRYLARVAKEVKRPIAINLSLGGQYDAHDGTDMLSMVVDEVSGRGCVVCVAAGNEGDDKVHARGSVKANGRLAMPLLVGDGRSMLHVSCWHDGSRRLDARVGGPFRSTPWVSADSAPAPFRLPEGVVTIASASPDPGNQDRNIFVMIESVPGETSITSGQWRLQFRSTDAASTEVDAWLIDGTGDNRPQARFGAPTVRNERKVGSPGAATKAITVASYTSRIEWASEAGPVGTDAALGEVSSFSSEGPRRDDVAKPDVMAPGSWLVSARSADATFPAALRVDGRHVALQGTSMATPFVTGLAALMLNEKPVSTAAQLKKRLVNACRPADGEPAAFEPKTGHGLIDTSLIWS